MKFCIYGAGAIGGLIGAHLARAGEDVTLIARGAHLAAMREKGGISDRLAAEGTQLEGCTNALNSAADRIDPQAVGPFDLPQDERDELQALQASQYVADAAEEW